MRSGLRVLLLALVVACEPAAPAGEADTGAADRGLRSEHFLIRPPAAAVGDRFLLLEGETTLSTFTVGVVRSDAVVVTEAVSTVPPAGMWRPFEVRLHPPNGLQPGDEVVFASVNGDAEPELKFQPIRSGR